MMCGVAILNSTWSSHPVVDQSPNNILSPHLKLWPGYISADHELDLYLYQHWHNVTWIPNIRGASATLRLNNVSSHSTAGAVVVDFDKDTREDVVEISADRRRLIIHQRETSFHRVKWREQVLLDVTKLHEVPNLSVP